MCAVAVCTKGWNLGSKKGWGGLSTGGGGTWDSGKNYAHGAREVNQRYIVVGGGGATLLIVFKASKEGVRRGVVDGGRRMCEVKV